MGLAWDRTHADGSCWQQEPKLTGPAVQFWVLLGQDPA